MKFLKHPLTIIIVVIALGAAYFLWNGGVMQQKNDKKVPVVAVAVKKEVFEDRIEALGTTMAYESITVTSKVSESVKEVKFTDRQEVKKDDELIIMDKSEEEADLADAEAQLMDAQRQYGRASKLVKDRVTSESTLDQRSAALRSTEARVEAAKARLADRVITAPFDGVLGLRMVSPGALVEPGTVITTLDDIHIIKLDFTVPEVYVPILREGMQITATAAAVPDKEFKGVIKAVDSRVDPITRAVTVRAELPNDSGEIKPGMLLTVILKADPRESLVIPEGALVPVMDKQFVFAIDAEDKAHRKEVTIGGRRPGLVEIRKGLEEGERVVTEGTLTLREGDKVSIAPPVAAEEKKDSNQTK